MKHGDVFELPARYDKDVLEKWVIVNPPEDTITHIVQARRLNQDSSLSDDTTCFFLPELERVLTPELRLANE